MLGIAGSAVAAGWTTIDRLVTPRAMQHPGWVLAAGVTGFLGHEFVARYRMRVGRRIGSAPLVADGLHARIDGFASLTVAAATAGSWAGLPWADPVVHRVPHLDTATVHPATHPGDGCHRELSHAAHLGGSVTT